MVLPAPRRRHAAGRERRDLPRYVLFIAHLQSSWQGQHGCWRSPHGHCGRRVEGYGLDRDRSLEVWRLSGAQRARLWRSLARVSTWQTVWIFGGGDISGGNGGGCIGGGGGGGRAVNRSLVDRLPKARRRGSNRLARLCLSAGWHAIEALVRLCGGAQRYVELARLRLARRCLRGVEIVSFVGRAVSLHFQELCALFNG